MLHGEEQQFAPIACGNNTNAYNLHFFCYDATVLFRFSSFPGLRYPLVAVGLPFS